jgi:hypothetical protein
MADAEEIILELYAKWLMQKNPTTIRLPSAPVPHKQDLQGIAEINGSLKDGQSAQPSA